MDANEIKDQARDMASNVRIKKDFADQDGVDKLLEQLGM